MILQRGPSKQQSLKRSLYSVYKVTLEWGVLEKSESQKTGNFIVSRSVQHFANEYFLHFRLQVALCFQNLVIMVRHKRRQRTTKINM